MGFDYLQSNLPIKAYIYIYSTSLSIKGRDRRGRIVIGFTTTCATSAAHHH